MIWTNLEQLPEELEKSIKLIYVLFGNNLFLLQNSKSNILKKINTLYQSENHNFKFNDSFDWNEILNLCKVIPLFAQRKVLSLQFSADHFTNLLNEKISLLCSLIHSHLILIILIYIPNQFPQKFTTWTQCFNKQSISFVNCTITNNLRLEKWIKNQSKNMNMVIENSACQLLCYYYEGNNIFLYQTLQYLSLIYPDGNLSYLRVKKIITDSAFFNFHHWVEAVLIGDKQRSNRILKKITYTNSDALKLMHKIQHEILIIIQIKYSIIQKTLLYSLFKKYKIYTRHRRILLSQAAQRLSFNQLNQSISLLIKMELQYYKNNMILSKLNFALLTEILCNKNKHCLLNNIVYNNII